jgi:hypothetical protein
MQVRLAKIVKQNTWLRQYTSFAAQMKAVLKVKLVAVNRMIVGYILIL